MNEPHRAPRAACARSPRSPRSPRSAASASALAIAAALLACACSGPGTPRFGEVTVSTAAPSATLSGSTHGTAPAIELSPGCPGYLDPGAPEHVVHLSDATSLTITARSSRGPLAIAITGEGEVRCDSDGGSGHAPHVTITQPGDYGVHVAALHEGEDLPYELAIAPTGSPTPATAGPAIAGAGQRQQVSVTITSDPAGATVRTPEGQVLGTTPAMFVLSLAPEEIGRERRFRLELPGRAPTDVSGRMIGGAVVLHATIPGGPVLASTSTPGHGAVAGTATMQGGELVASANSEQRIRDYQVARQSLDVGRACTIANASVDVDIRHTFIGDLRVVLRSPRGTQVTLHNHGGGGRANLVTSYDWNARRGALQALAGEDARGRWEMAVHDDAGADVGTFRSFTLHLGCVENGALATGTRTGATTSAGAHPDLHDPFAGSRAGSASRGGSRGGSRSGAVGARADVLDPWRRAQAQPQPPPPQVRPQPPPPQVRIVPQPPPPQPWQSPQVGSTGRVNGGGGAGRTVTQPF